MSNERRIEKIDELIKREIGSLLLRDYGGDGTYLLTVTDVKTAGNIQTAKVFISIMPEAKSEKIMRFLQHRIHDIQHYLNRQLRMRPVPKIILVADMAGAKMSKTLEAIRKLKDDPNFTEN